MADRELLVRILGDDRDLQRALSNTERSVERLDQRTATFGRNIGRAFAAAGITIGASEALRLADQSVEAASDLQEQLSRTNIILGESADEMIAWSETTATAMGIAQREALAAAAGFAGLFQTVGLAPAAAGQLSRELVQLAADLASLQNTSPEQALLALRSALVGESEPLRRYNVFLSEAQVQQIAMAQSGKENVKQLTNQEKTLARYAIIMRDSAQAQGNFSQTSGELANQQRILAAQADELQVALGTLLLPTLTDVVSSLNDLAGAAVIATEALQNLQAIGAIEIPIDVPINFIQVGRGKDIGGFFESIKDGVRDAVASGLAGGGQAFENIIQRAQSGAGLGFTLFPSPPEDRAAPRKKTPTKDKLTADAEDEARRVKKELEAAQKRFAALTKGLGLKLDKARLTEDLNNDIAVLRELERAILRQIGIEGKTFKLVQQLTDTRLAINALVQRQAENARQAGVDAFNATIDALDLKLESARSTRSLADDQAALRAIEQRILSRIASEGETTDLLRRLFKVREEQKRVAKELADQARERRQQRQFGALGLTEEGERPTPGVGALSRRLTNLREQIKGTTLDTEKTRRELDRIAAVLSGKFGAVGKEVRNAILEMFNDIAGALDEGGSKTGPLTKTSGLNTKKILAGLGLSEQEVAELRKRLSSINTAGQQLAAVQSTVPGASFGAGTGATAGAVVVENHVTVEIDGQKVEGVVTKQQQKRRRRNPPQKRGPNRGGR